MHERPLSPSFTTSYQRLWITVYWQFLSAICPPLTIVKDELEKQSGGISFHTISARYKENIAPRNPDNNPYECHLPSVSCHYLRCLNDLYTRYNHCLI